jgi:hypothetical protein
MLFRRHMQTSERNGEGLETAGRGQGGLHRQKRWWSSTHRKGARHIAAWVLHHVADMKLHGSLLRTTGKDAQETYEAIFLHETVFKGDVRGGKGPV